MSKTEHTPPGAGSLRDGRWYSIILRHPRTCRDAQWDSGNQHFIWEGTSESHYLGLDEVGEILHEIEAPE